MIRMESGGPLGSVVMEFLFFYFFSFFFFFQFTHNSIFFNINFFYIVVNMFVLSAGFNATDKITVSTTPLDNS